MTDRLDLFPSIGNEKHVKHLIQNTQRNKSILEKKLTALKINIGKYESAKKKCLKIIFRQLYFASLRLRRARFQNVALSNLLVTQPPKASIKLILSSENVMGIQLPIFELSTKENEFTKYLGMNCGKQMVNSSKRFYYYALKFLIELAENENKIKLLMYDITLTNRRCNAFEYILIPRYENTLRYIRNELDEMNREEFYRFKKILETKHRKGIESELQREKERQRQLEKEQEEEDEVLISGMSNKSQLLMNKYLSGLNLPRPS